MKGPLRQLVIDTLTIGGLVFTGMVITLGFVNIADAQETPTHLEVIERHYQGIRAAAVTLARFQDDPIMVKAANRIIANSEEVADGNWLPACYMPSLRTILNNGYRGQERAYYKQGGDSEANVLFSTILIHATILTEGECEKLKN